MPKKDILSNTNESDDYKKLTITLFVQHPVTISAVLNSIKKEYNVNEIKVENNSATIILNKI